MSPLTQPVSSLSDSASIVLGYLQEYVGIQDPDEELKELKFVLPDLREQFPLLNFLFDSNSRLIGAIAELETTASEFVANVKIAQSFDQHYHRVVDQYIKLNFEEILERIPFEELQEVFGSEHADRNVTTLGECLEFRESDQLNNAAELSNQYARAVNEPLECAPCPHERGRLIQLLAEKCGLTSMVRNQSAQIRRVAVGWFYADSIVPYRRLDLCFVVLNSDHDLDIQLKELSRHKPEAAVILKIGCGPGFEAKLDSVVTGCKAIVLDNNDLKLIAISKDPAEALRSHILRRLPLRFLSPYRSAGPVTGEIFFGRVGELRTILEMPNVNYCVLGARRMGKTSFLHALRDKINVKKVLPDTTAIYVDAGLHNRMDRFQKHLLSAISPDLWLESTDEYFEDLTDLLKRTGKRYIFLLDEVDALLQSKNAGLLEAFARSIANEGYARFVFCGYNVLSERIKNRMSPMYNLFELVRLGPLKRIDARELVRQPMSRIGVEFDKDDVIDQILELGSTVPWLLQYMCQLLVEQLEDRRGERRISRACVNEVYNCPAFSKAMTESITDENMPVLMRLVIYLAVQSERDELHEREIFEAARKATYNSSFSDIRKALDYLAATYVFRKIGDCYRFYLPQVKRKLRETEPDLQFVISGLATEYRERLP